MFLEDKRLFSSVSAKLNIGLNIKLEARGQRRFLKMVSITFVSAKLKIGSKVKLEAWSF